MKAHNTTTIALTIDIIISKKSFINLTQISGTSIDIGDDDKRRHVPKSSIFLEIPTAVLNWLKIFLSFLYL